MRWGVRPGLQLRRESDGLRHKTYKYMQEAKVVQKKSRVQAGTKANGCEIHYITRYKAHPSRQSRPLEPLAKPLSPVYGTPMPPCV